MGTRLSYRGDFFPNIYVTHLRYNEAWNDTAGAGITYYIYRGNSIFDPYYGAGGDTVYGYDTISALYGRYKVLSSSIRVEMVNRGGEPVNVYLYPTYYTAVPTFSTSDAAPNCKRALLNADAGKSVVLTHFAKTSDILNVHNDKDATALMGANPVEPWHWKIYMKNITLAALDVFIKVTIRYHVELSLRAIVNDVDA